VRKYVFALVMAVAFAGLSQAAPAGNSGVSVTKPAPPQQRLLPDVQIERNIRAKLAKSKMNATEHFTVTVHNGVAVLEGKTNVIQHKGVATRLAKGGGATAVQNNIQVSDAAKAKAAAGLARLRAPAGGPVRATVVQASK
jgi:osmotically-inducible protein OsmY